MKLSYFWNYLVFASFTVTALAGNVISEAKGLAQTATGKPAFCIAQGQSGYSSGDSLAPRSNPATGDTANTSGYSPGDSFGSLSNQAPGARRGCCPGGMKLIQDWLNANSSASSDGYHLAGNPPTGDGNSGQATPPITMMLYGDGVSTAKATLELTCGGHTTTIPLQTICTSGKTKRPWPSREVALQEHVQYQLGLTDPQLLNIVQAASDQNAQGLYAKLAISPSRKLQTMTQLATWMYEARATGNPADLVTPQVVAGDICQQSHTSLSSLSPSENKELTDHVMDMLLAADETEKHSHLVVWQPPPPPELPPPLEVNQPDSPPSAGSPPLELVCIPAGTRFVTSDCRYQSCMVIACAYVRCPRDLRQQDLTQQNQRAGDSHQDKRDYSHSTKGDSEDSNQNPSGTGTNPPFRTMGGSADQNPNTGSGARTGNLSATNTITTGVTRVENVSPSDTITVGTAGTVTVSPSNTITVGAARTENVSPSNTITIGRAPAGNSAGLNGGTIVLSGTGINSGAGTAGAGAAGTYTGPITLTGTGIGGSAAPASGYSGTIPWGDGLGQNPMWAIPGIGGVILNSSQPGVGGGNGTPWYNVNSLPGSVTYNPMSGVGGGNGTPWYNVNPVVGSATNGGGARPTLNPFYITGNGDTGGVFTANFADGTVQTPWLDILLSPGIVQRLGSVTGGGTGGATSGDDGGSNGISNYAGGTSGVTKNLGGKH